MSYIYTPSDIARFLIKRDFTISDEQKIIHEIWWRDKHINLEYLQDEALFNVHVHRELTYYMMKEDVDEVAQVVSDIDPNYMLYAPAIEQNSPLAYFKQVRLELMYLYGKDHHRIKMRTLLAGFGYKRRTQGFVEKIEYALSTLSLRAYTRGHLRCSIAKIDIDDMLIIRLHN